MAVRCAMLAVRLENDRICVGGHFSMSFQRTLRVPDDGRDYPLPPGLGAFPVMHADLFGDRLPPNWRGRGEFFIPMYQREALWVGFDAPEWQPHAVKLGGGLVNAISGEPWSQNLCEEPQDYVVCPPQLWLDGINAGEEFIRQFVAMPLGSGVTVEGQLTGQ